MNDASSKLREKIRELARRDDLASAERLQRQQVLLVARDKVLRLAVDRRREHDIVAVAASELRDCCPERNDVRGPCHPLALLVCRSTRHVKFLDQDAFEFVEEWSGRDETEHASARCVPHRRGCAAVGQECREENVRVENSPELVSPSGGHHQRDASPLAGSEYPSGAQQTGTLEGSPFLPPGRCTRGARGPRGLQLGAPADAQHRAPCAQAEWEW